MFLSTGLTGLETRSVQTIALDYHFSPQSHSHVPEGPRHHAASSIARWNLDIRSGVARNIDSRAIDICSIATDGQVTTIKDRGILQIKSVTGPIDIRLISWIAALLSKCLLPCPSEISMPE